MLKLKLPLLCMSNKVLLTHFLFLMFLLQIPIKDNGVKLESLLVVLLLKKVVLPLLTKTLSLLD